MRLGGFRWPLHDYMAAGVLVAGPSLVLVQVMPVVAFTHARDRSYLAPMRVELYST